MMSCQFDSDTGLMRNKIVVASLLAVTFVICVIGLFFDPTIGQGVLAAGIALAFGLTVSDKDNS